MTNSTHRFRTLTVGDLKALLADHDDDTSVIFSCDYGDICHTKQALPLKGDTEMVAIEDSAYSNSGYALADRDHGDYDDGPDTIEDGDEAKYLLIR